MSVGNRPSAYGEVTWCGAHDTISLRRWVYGARASRCPVVRGCPLCATSDPHGNGLMQWTISIHAQWSLNFAFMCSGQKPYFRDGESWRLCVADFRSPAAALCILALCDVSMTAPRAFAYSARLTLR